jgi:hypothetical protein
LGFWFLLGFEFFFRFRVHPRVKNETRIQTRFCAGQVQVVATKMHPNPHPSGAKPTGDLKPEPELPSLHKYCSMNKRLTKANQSGKKYITIHTSNFFFFFLCTMCYLGKSHHLNCTVKNRLCPSTTIGVEGDNLITRPFYPSCSI